MKRLLDILIAEDGGPTVEDCMQKLHEIGWTARTPLYFEASIVFAENSKARKEWIRWCGTCDTPNEEEVKRCIVG
uniref:Uncharacterized protein n=1 Tax=Nelumbo nucifera TaxID=4432 RepID=A0A822Z1N1_NELNU|nr:TPA_asm: hypothetical protein HUJ06_009064 [Nelumbo nucifera]DAD38424.1 TPA_asm: hypothetical protein HUJ06_009065 [Nelumbo nucifera]